MPAEDLAGISIPSTEFQDSFSKEVWETTYKDHEDKDVNDTFRRVAGYVASAEETNELKELWEGRFFDMLSNFKCTAGGRIYANAGTEWGGTTLMNCFNPEVEVITASGPKPICDVEKGEYVLTHKGRFREVVNTLVRHYTGPVQRFCSSYFTDDIISTPEHPYYQGDNKWVTSEYLYSVVLPTAHDNSEYQNIDLVDLLIEHQDSLVELEDGMIATSKSFIGGNGAKGQKTGIPVKRNVEVNPSFAYLLGRFVGDGCTFKNNKTSLFEVDAFTIAFDQTTEQRAAELLISRFNDVFGITPNLITSQNNTLCVRKASQIVASSLRRLVGEGFASKTIPNIIWESPFDVQWGFLCGVFDADGFVGERSSVMIEMTNPQLISQIQTLMTMCGIPCAKKNNRLFAGSTFTVDFRKSLTKHYIDNRLYYEPTQAPTTGPVKLTDEGFSIVPERIDEEYDGYVYNLSVDEDESYVVNNVAVHNCFVSPRADHDIDSLPQIVADVLNQAQTLKSEGGWGQNFSWLRPRGAFIRGIGVETPGAVKYMEIYDKVSDVITSGSGTKSANKKAKGKIRKGAMMGVLDVWHPDVVEFITAKQQPGRLTKFNVSVNCTDEFMHKVVAVQEMTVALKENRPSHYCLKDGEPTIPNERTIEWMDQWVLRFPDTTHERYKEEWRGDLKAWEAKGYTVVAYRMVSATWLWNLIMESTYNRAEPGVLFLDRANFFGPLNYKETITATNPCLVGDTLVATNRGLVSLEELVHGNRDDIRSCLTSPAPIGGDDAVFFTPINGKVCSGVKDVVTIHLSNGMEVTATPDHRFFTTTGAYVEAKDLLGNSLPLVSLEKALEKNTTNWPMAVSAETKNRVGLGWSEDFAFVLGWLTGDGWMTGDKIGVIFGKDDVEARERIISIFYGWGYKNLSETLDKNGSTTLYIHSKVLAQHLRLLGFKQCRAKDKTVPSAVFQTSKEMISQFLDGLFSADGSVLNMKGGNYWVSLASSSKQLVNGVQQLLLMLGITHHKTYFINKSSVFEYTTVEGELRTYIGAPYYDLRIFGMGIKTFFETVSLTINRKQQRLDALAKKRFKFKDLTVEVVNIEPAGRELVYDLNVPITHNFITNGLVVHNCGEQTLAAGGVCNLGSVNLTQFVLPDRTGFDLNRLEKYVRYLNRFLDNINSLSHAPLPEYVESMRKKRRIGIGILGWGSALLMLKVRFGSERASYLREQVMNTIAREAYMSSIDLASEKGMFELCDSEKHVKGAFIMGLNLPQEYVEKLRRVGIRNSSLLSIQPTGNTSIFANVASGGLEPVFMPEYIRTVIVNHMPEHIADVTPRWYEGEWHETEMFKAIKEGDDEILRGISPDGVVYKIDKNRGLTKEVLCEDYGVRFLKDLGEWDPTAEWAVTTDDLTVRDHVRDLKGFARWVDSAMSKTVNVPHDYSFEDFKDIYLEAYKSGFVKGVTTYRAGTMMSVLSAKEEKTATDFDEEIIEDDVKLPSQMPATVTIIRAEGKKWYLTTVMNRVGSRPVAFFVHTNHHEKNVTTEGAIDGLLALAKERGIPERWIEETREKFHKDSNSTKIARAISLNLRHGVLIKNVVSVLDRVENVYAGSFLFQIKKILGTYIKDGEKVVGETCQDCGSTNVVYSEGCKKCMSCGSSKCG